MSWAKAFVGNLSCDTTHGEIDNCRRAIRNTWRPGGIQAKG